MLGSALLLILGHPESLSHSRVTVVDTRATVELRFQSLSLLEVHPELDLDHDGELDPTELRKARDSIASYLGQRYRLFVVDGEREVPLEGSLEALEVVGAGEPDPGNLQRLDARVEFEAEKKIELLVVESTLFHETNPWHKDFCTLTWNGDAPVPHAFEGGDTRWRFEPAHVRRSGVWTSFMRLGAEHILGGWDHLAFLLVLLVASSRILTLLGVITAFTLAHSITLALAALDVVRAPSAPVELLIAASIAWVGLANLLQRGPVARWKEAFLFGLVHGLGFATALRELLTGDARRLLPLVGFNLGVEAGQLMLVVAALALLWIGRRALRRREAAGEAARALAPRAVRLVASAGVAAAGLFWVAQRAADVF